MTMEVDSIEDSIIRQSNPLSFSSTWSSRRRRITSRTSSSSTSSTFLLCILVACILQIVRGQTPKCSCTPTVYRWRVDFSRTCPPVNVLTGSGRGISVAQCQISTIPSNLTDITYLQVLELGPTLASVEKVEIFRESRANNSVIEFASITSAMPNVTSVGLQVYARANTTTFQTVEMQWIIAFSNLCEVDVVSNGDSLGWLVFENLIPARESTCALPSQAPSTKYNPSSAPSKLPSRFPTQVPSQSQQPSKAPSIPPQSMDYNDNSNRLLFANWEDWDTFGLLSDEIKLRDEHMYETHPKKQTTTTTKRHRIPVIIDP